MGQLHDLALNVNFMAPNVNTLFRIARKLATDISNEPIMTNSKSRYYRWMFTSASLFNLCAGAMFATVLEPVYKVMGGGDIPHCNG